MIIMNEFCEKDQMEATDLGAKPDVSFESAYPLLETTATAAELTSVNCLFWMQQMYTLSMSLVSGFIHFNVTKVTECL